MQINEYRYLITHIRTESNSTAMAMGLTSFFALWFLNTLRRVREKGREEGGDRVEKQEREGGLKVGKEKAFPPADFL